MTGTRGALGLALLAMLGLVVSATAIWSRPDPLGVGPVAGSPARAVSAVPVPAAAAAPRRVDPDPLPVLTATSLSPLVPRSSAAVTAVRRGPRPVRVTVRTADLDTPVRPVGVQRDGQMQLPANPSVLGWYRFGPAPGAGSGAVVLGGHLDAYRFGLGPLVGLREVKPGERVRVELSNGARRTYEVRSVRRFDRQALPEGLFSRRGPERLHLVTCGGAFDPDAGGYQLNLVVTAVPV